LCKRRLSEKELTEVSSGETKTIRLLLVDDETDFRTPLAKRMQKRGITVFQAGGGEEGLALLADHPVDVVVMDVKMPGMSGIEALDRIKAMEIETEVILLTGHAATQDGVDGIKSGAFDYLSKPVAFEHLLGKIRQAHDKIMAARQKREAAEYKARIRQQMIATERLAALGTLAAGVAHEINNPLAIINESAGYLSQLLEKKELAEMPHREAFEKALSKIESGVKRARNITHQLLDSVRKSEPLLAEIDLGELVGETIRLFRREVRDRRIDVLLTGADEPSPIWTDPDQLRQVLINLLSNAIHAVSDQGQITVRIEADAGGASVSIDDDGPGIPREHLEKIFEPFFSTKPPGEGTGLGLFVTREIVEKLGGTVAVDSHVGQGSRFTVQIPAGHPDKWDAEVQ
jgi:signal transduction histidine kinase